MIKQEMKLVDYNLKTTKDGSRNYLSAKFEGHDDKGVFTVSTNLDATKENQKMLIDNIAKGFTTEVEYDPETMESGTMKGKAYRYADITKNSHYDVLRAFGFDIPEPKKLSKDEYIAKQLNK